jgi:integrase
MTVQDLWLDKHKNHTKRWGVGRRWRVHNQGWPTVSCRTRAEADLINARQIAEGLPSTGDDQETVRQACAVWLAGKAGLTRKARTTAKEAAGYVIERWGDLLVTDLEPREVQAWVAGLQSSRGPASVALKSNVVQAIKGAAGGKVDMSTLKAGRVRPHEARFLNVEQLEKLAEACKPYEPMVWLLGTCGLRISECCALNVADVNVKAGRLRVRFSKNGYSRDVPIAASVLRMIDLERDGREPLFVNSRGGRVDPDNWRSRVFRDACEQARLDGMRIHDLRHTAASLAISSGADVKAVQRMLGHASAKMTLDLYGHLWDRSLDDVAMRMDRLMAGRG